MKQIEKNTQQGDKDGDGVQFHDAHFPHTWSLHGRSLAPIINTNKKLSCKQSTMPKLRYKEVVDRLAADIREGRLRPGTQLPTHRKLAMREGLALVTATRVYAELHAMGLVSGEIGRGTFVKEALPRGHGVDLPAWSTTTIDLSFNSPSVPGQTDLLRTAFASAREFWRCRSTAALSTARRPSA